MINLYPTLTADQRHALNTQLKLLIECAGATCHLLQGLEPTDPGPTESPTTTESPTATESPTESPTTSESPTSTESPTESPTTSESPTTTEPGETTAPIQP